jgi:hypothetical protein
MSSRKSGRKPAYTERYKHRVASIMFNMTLDQADIPGVLLHPGDTHVIDDTTTVIKFARDGKCFEIFCDDHLTVLPNGLVVQMNILLKLAAVPDRSSQSEERGPKRSEPNSRGRSKGYRNPPFRRPVIAQTNALRH